MITLGDTVFSVGGEPCTAPFHLRPQLIHLFITQPDAQAEQKASIKGTDLLAPLQNSAAFVVPRAGWLLNFADLLGLESENTLPSQQGWCCGPRR